MARIDWIERRLLNWARWTSSRGAGNLGYAAVRLGSGVGTREAYREARIPLSDCEAEETARAVLALPSELRATVEAYYTRPGTVEDQLEHLCIARPTLYARLERADTCLARWLDDRQRQRAEERARVEAVQHASRPRGAC
jgi:hypothetical protein